MLANHESNEKKTYRNYKIQNNLKPSRSFAYVLVVVFVILCLQQPCQCRYLPTRTNGNDLDKLRELIIQILERGNEEYPRNQPQINEWKVIPRSEHHNWLNNLNMAEHSRPNYWLPYQSATYENGHY